MQTFSSAWSYLDHLIDSLRAQLPPLEDLNIEPTSPTITTWMKMSYLAHALTYTASMKLHTIFAYSYPGYSEHTSTSRGKCLAVAREMLRSGEIYVNSTNGADIGCVNPIMGVCDFFPVFLYPDLLFRRLYG